VPLTLDEDTFRSVIESLATGVYLVDLERRILLWNHGAEKITGYLRQEVIGHSCFDNLLTHCDEHSRLVCDCACPLAGTMRDGKAREVDVFLRHKNGERVPVRVRAVAIRDRRGLIVGAAQSFDERESLPEREPHQAAHGGHDGAPQAAILDRHAVQSQLTASLLDFEDFDVPFSVLNIAIDKFAEFRELHGSRAAEKMAGVVGHTLARNIGPSDYLGHWDDGRFVVIVAGRPAGELEKLAEMSRRIVSLVAIPWWGDRLSVTISTGAAVAQARDTVDSLLERSENALGRSQITPVS
jgi:PAS domain S-box-containing protein